MKRDSHIVEIEIEKIVPNRFQPRKTFSDDISELAESIRTHGVLQPITVRPLGEKFEIIMGERRFRACEKLGLSKIPCMIVEMDDHESMEVALIENLQRQDLSPIEEALSYKRLLEAGYATQEQLAQRLGKNQSTIANKLRLLSLDKEVQGALLKNEISERHARTLLKLKNKEFQKILLKKIVTERLTVKKTEEEVKKMEDGEYKSSPINDSIEIIDFGDNPFKDPTPNYNSVDDKVESNNGEEVVDNQEKMDFVVPKSEFDFSNVEKNDELEEKVEQKFKPVIPSLGIIDDIETGNIKPTIESNHSFNSSYDIDEDFSLNNVIPDTIQIENQEFEKLESLKENNVPNISINDFNQIKLIIEKCQSEIKALGYNVEFEKIDFETMYQIIFKIKKQ